MRPKALAYRREEDRLHQAVLKPIEKREWWLAVDSSHLNVKRASEGKCV